MKFVMRQIGIDSESSSFFLQYIYSRYCNAAWEPRRKTRIKSMMASFENDFTLLSGIGCMAYWVIHLQKSPTVPGSFDQQPWFRWGEDIIFYLPDNLATRVSIDGGGTALFLRSRNFRRHQQQTQKEQSPRNINSNSCALSPLQTLALPHNTLSNLCNRH